MPLKQPPRSNEKREPDDFGIGAPAAPKETAPVFHLKPTKEQVQAAARRKAAAEALKRTNAIFAARQDINEKKAIQQRVTAKAGLTPTTSPFAGAEHGKDAAKPSAKVESGDLTPNVKLAKERLRLLTQGGLQGPAQRLDALLAQTQVAMSRNLNLRDTHQLPAALTRLSTHIPTPAPGLKLGAPEAPAEDATTRHAAGRDRSVTGPTPKGGGIDLPGIDVDWGGIKRSIEAGAPPDSAIGALLRTADIGGLVGKLAAPKRADLPHIPVPSNFLTEEAKAASKGKPVYTDQLSDSERYGEYSLGAAGRAYFVKLAGENGYNVKDAPTWNDSELAAYALGPKNAPSITGFVRNLAGDVGQQAALASAVSMYGETAKDAIEQRSLAPIARLGGGYAQGWLKLLPHFGDRPFIENAYERPLSTYLAVAPGAKGVSGMLGRHVLHLSPEREVTLPSQRRAVENGQLKPGEDVETLPASQHPIARLGQAAHDRILAHSVAPHERAAAERANDTVRHPGAEAAHIAGSVPSRVGHKLEERIVRKKIDALHMKARLTAGHEPALALEALFKSYRELPFMRSILQGYKDNGGKEAEIEALIKHHGAATSSDQMAEGYLNHAAESEQRAAELDIDAELAPNGATAARYRAGAEELRADADRQRKQAKYSDEAGIDIHDPKKGAQEVVDAMREASSQSAQLLQSQHLIDDKGRLYGDWQHRIDMIEKTEGPGTPRGGDEGTPGYQIAHAIIKEGGLREAHDVARAAFHGVETKDVDSVPLTEDVRSDLAEHHAGRNRFAREILRLVTPRQVARNARVNSAAGDLAVDAASSGLDHAGVRRAVKQAGNLLNAKQAAVEQRGHTRASDAADSIHNLESQEREAHNAKSNERITRLEADLHVAEVKKAPRVKQDEIRREIENEKKHLSDGYEPSRELLNARAQHERASLHRFSFELAPREIDQIVAGVRNESGGLEKTPQQEALLRAAIQQEIDKSPALNTASQLAHAIGQDSARSFKETTGKDVSLAHDFDRASANYLRGLRGLRDQQQPLGHDPFHLHLHKPSTEYGLQPTTITTGVQWAEGDYTRDMHYLVARDLSGLQRKAVEGALFQALSKESLIIDAPPVGSVVPPGWLRVPNELMDNLTKVNKDAAKVRELQMEWRNLGTGSHSGSRVEENESLVSSHLKDWISQELDRGNTDINGALKAMNMYRRWMLFTLPRTYVNNTVGNPILAMIMGSKMRDLTEAIHVLRKHPDRIPNTLRRRGPISNVMEKPNAKMVGWQSFWRSANSFSEDLGNVMVYLKHARGGFKDVNNLKWFNHVGKDSENWTDYLTKAAKGETDDAVGPSIKAAEAFGDMYKLSKHDSAFATTFLFHRWVGHMIHLTYWTLPAKYPGRTLFIQQTATLANQYRKEHGEFPEWAVAYVPLWHEIAQAGGLPQDVVWSLGTGGVNPFQTPGQSVDFGTVDQPKSIGQSLLSNNLSPPIRIGLETAFSRRLDTLEPFQDYHGNDINGPSWRVLANSVIANLPVVNTVFPRAGLSDDSIQIPWNIGFENILHPRYSAGAAYDPSMRSPQALGHGELYDWLLRVGGALGAPIRPVDAAGSRGAASANRTLNYQASQATKRETKKGAEDYQNQLELFQRDPDAWRKKYGPGAKK